MAAYGLSDFGVVGFRQIRRLVRAVAVHEVLQSLDVPGRGVVDDNNGDAKAHTPSRLQLTQHHVEATIPREADHCSVRRGQLRAHGARQAVADRCETSVRHKFPRRLARVEQQSAPVRGETTVSDEIAVVGQAVVDLLNEARHVHGRLVGVQAVGDAVTPDGHLFGHLLEIAVARRSGYCGARHETRVKILETCLGVAPELQRRRIGTAHLLGNNVHMNKRLAHDRHSETLGSDLPQLAAHHQKAVAGFDQVVGDAVVSAE